ncbi:hypothetical protein, partial [Bacillus inaquosorum]
GSLHIDTKNGTRLTMAIPNNSK